MPQRFGIMAMRLRIGGARFNRLGKQRFARLPIAAVERANSPLGKLPAGRHLFGHGTFATDQHLTAAEHESGDRQERAPAF